jgi:hypothetical protein
MSSDQPSTPAPGFPIVDGDGAGRELGDFRGSPVVVAFSPHPAGRAPAAMQLVTFADEHIPLVTVSDPAVAALYQVSNRSAIFVVADDGTIAWRYRLHAQRTARWHWSA